MLPAMFNDALNLKTEDRTAITALLTNMVDAWNAGNAQAYGQSFTDDCDYVSFNGDWAQGVQEMVQDHQKLFDTFLRGSTLRFDSVEMRSLGSDVVLLHCIGNSLLRAKRHTSHQGVPSKHLWLSGYLQDGS